MQKVLRDNLLRRNQKLKAGLKEGKKKLKHEFWEYQRARVGRERNTRKLIQDERKHRREDWMCGPLAPRRDVGLQRGVYGVANGGMTQPLKLPKSLQIKEGDRLFAEKDRVVIVKGLDKGKIGTIRQIDWESNSAIVEGLNTFDFEVPRWQKQGLSLPTKVDSHDTYIPIEDFRLVFKVQDADGCRDVVIRHMYAGEPYKERPEGSTLPKHTRYVSGLNVELDWPQDNPSEEAAHPGDMSRFDTETIPTNSQFHPWILHAPFDGNLIDELDNKFAKGRGRHDYTWMSQKIIQDAEKTWREKRKMLTPKQEYHEAKLKAKLATSSPTVSEETQKAIRDMQSMKLGTDNVGSTYSS